MKKKQLQNFLVWAIGISFIAIGALKYMNLEEWSASVFNRAHYPRWFFYVVGVVEFIAGFLLLMTASTSRRIGSLLIALIMLGAIGTRWLLNEHSQTLILPGVIFITALLMSFRFGGSKQP